MKPSCSLCGQQVKRKLSSFCSRSCASKFRTKDRNLISKDDLIQDYTVNKMTWKSLCEKHTVSVSTLMKYLNKYEIKYHSDFDFSSQKIGNLTVCSKSYIKNTKQYWKCVCDCGIEYHTTSGVLGRSKTISCEACRHISSRETDTIKTTLWNRYINGANKRNLEFSVTKEYALGIYEKQEKRCALSGVIITFSPSQGKVLRSTTTASLDRIDSTKGYVENNIQWVHKRVNRLKMDMSEDELFEWCQLIHNKRN